MGVPAAALVGIFAGSAIIIWVAGIALSDSTDALDARLGLGSALGGLVLLSIATDLPEIAITVSATAGGHVGLAVGNLLGGIAIQTLVLAWLDARSEGPEPLSHRPGSLLLVIEGSTVVAVTVAAVMTSQLPESTELAGLSPGSVAIVLLWIGGLVIVNSARKGLPWRAEAPGSARGRSAVERSSGKEPQPLKSRGTAVVAALFAAAAAATLVAGLAIEESGSELASRIGLSGPVFGATILAASTALPELSTGLASVKLGDYELAFSDIFGGNAFLPVLFVVADLVGGRPALPSAAATDVWMAGLGVVLSAIYVTGLVLRPRRRVLGIGPDSAIAVLVYALGIVGLAVIANAM